MIYLASPYSHPDPKVREWRHEKVCRMAGMLMAEGLHIFSPIAHSHVIAGLAGLPTTWDFWREKDFHMIDLSKALIIYQLEDWNHSVGVLEERGYAIAGGLSVYLLEDTNDKRRIHEFSQRFLRKDAQYYKSEEFGLHGKLG